MNKKQVFTLISFLLIASTLLVACGGGTATATPTPVAPQATEASTDAVESSSTELALKIEGDLVSCYNGETLIATIEFIDNTIDNNPTEWLKGRTGLCYLYQSGIGNSVKFKVTLYADGVFASDGDAFAWNGQQFGVKNNADDVIVLGDQPGEYVIGGDTFGLAVGIATDTPDRAANVLNDRRNATGYDGRAEWWLPSNNEGEPKQINAQ